MSSSIAGLIRAIFESYEKKFLLYLLLTPIIVHAAKDGSLKTASITGLGHQSLHQLAVYIGLNKPCQMKSRTAPGLFNLTLADCRELVCVPAREEFLSSCVGYCSC